MSKPRKRIRGKPARDRSCEGKQRFDTMEAAEAAAYRPRRMLLVGGFMKAYPCRFCGGFHYGHPTRS